MTSTPPTNLHQSMCIYPVWAPYLARNHLELELPGVFFSPPDQARLYPANSITRHGSAYPRPRLQVRAPSPSIILSRGAGCNNRTPQRRRDPYHLTRRLIECEIQGCSIRLERASSAAFGLLPSLTQCSCGAERQAA